MFTDSSLLPPEIILVILDLSLPPNPTYNAMLQLSLLSRKVYHLMLPRLYSSLDLEMPLSPSAHSINRTLLLASAQPSSLVYTRHIISRPSSLPFTFSPFSRLSHLALWGHNCLSVGATGRLQAQEIVTLPLEELSVWEEIDNSILLGNLTRDVQIWRTLRRFACAANTIGSRPYEGWLTCPNLVQILLFFENHQWFLECAASGITLSSSPKFQCFVISPFSTIPSLPPLTAVNTLRHLIQDRKVVLLRNYPTHMFIHPRSFWKNNSDMWKVLMGAVEKNENITASFFAVSDLKSKNLRGI
ncbi:hypothetical protein DL96DRAFT_1821476 [Flagelloscypha sp. PMI_526]|nr:hypothetical protein DL96DRAFT_1821476 [Flagelloscypha sp. PMI_526]